MLPTFEILPSHVLHDNNYCFKGKDYKNSECRFGLPIDIILDTKGYMIFVPRIQDENYSRIN